MGWTVLDSNPGGVIFSALIQAGSEAHTAPLYSGYREFFEGLKRAEH
jgi:hypothetical protein